MVARDNPCACVRLALVEQLNLSEFGAIAAQKYSSKLPRLFLIATCLYSGLLTQRCTCGCVSGVRRTGGLTTICDPLIHINSAQKTYILVRLQYVSGHIMIASGARASSLSFHPRMRLRLHVSVFPMSVHELPVRLQARADVLSGSTLIPLPHPMIIAGERFRETYYWDSFWILKGLLASHMWTSAARIVLNFIHLVHTHGFVPNGCRVRHPARFSQAQKFAPASVTIAQLNERRRRCIGARRSTI